MRPNKAHPQSTRRDLRKKANLFGNLLFVSEMRGWKRRDQREPSIERRPVILADTHARPSRAATATTAAAAIPPSHLLPDRRRSPPRRRRPPPRAAYRPPTASSSVSSGSRPSSRCPTRNKACERGSAWPRRPPSFTCTGFVGVDTDLD